MVSEVRITMKSETRSDERSEYSVGERDLEIYNCEDRSCM